MKLLVYKNQKGTSPLSDWLNKNRDIQARIRQRLRRLEQGHFGDVKYVGDEIYEMRFFFGSGYRVYYGMEEDQIIVLLCGGDKSTQSRDIEKAKEYWMDYKERKND